MVRIKTCRLTRNPQLGDPVAWLGVAVSGASVETAYPRVIRSGSRQRIETLSLRRSRGRSSSRTASLTAGM